ncbi:putative interleukin-17 receptor E-like [Parambassis ranga]|uniref:Interleukin-17 receptor E-like n=1 Tax=Parambassis ranga TaxID=210632 RepID=A0A6P7I1I0_9TELE|nr:putative interleukin-17 receptor E-like [Parambassis ranga]
MILWLTLLISHCCLGLNVASATESTELERTENCQTRCSQGLNCKTKPDYTFPRPCHKPAGDLNTTSVFKNTTLSTVMSCEGRQKCSLHLRIKTTLQLADYMHGVSICTVTTGMMEKCQVISFTRASRQKMSGQQVEVETDCIDVSPNQQVQVTVKTMPSYCGISWAGTYHTPGCTHEDLRRHVPECITGRLSYEVYPERKELSVNVSDVLEDHSYYLRLCRKDFICIGTGSFTLIKKEQSVKSVVFSYSQPLPCLCIEGWTAVMDAPRVQVCPFKDRLEVLWFGITFDPLEESLLWQPACAVSAVAALCQKREDGVCVDFRGSQNVSREKVIFSKVDPHPQLCMKFSVASQSWIRCPFDSGRFQAWSIVETSTQGLEEVKMVSEITARFSVGQCVKSAGSPVCQATETHSVFVEKHKAVALNLTEELCNSCLQVKRTDVTFAATVLHCFKQCDGSLRLGVVKPDPDQTTWDVAWVVVAGVCLSGILMVIMVTLALHVLLTVYQRRKKQGNGVCTSEKQMDCVVSALQAKAVLHGEVLLPDSPQCGNNEKANLLSK